MNSWIESRKNNRQSASRPPPGTGNRHPSVHGRDILDIRDVSTAMETIIEAVFTAEEYLGGSRQFIAGLYEVDRFSGWRQPMTGFSQFEIQVGDFVAILAGCQLPVVLRPCEGSFVFMGMAPVAGLMKGEGVCSNGVYVEMENEVFTLV